MAKVVQIRRGTESQNNSFTGKQGEITMTTDTHKLRVHDGSTRGGFALASQADLTALSQRLEAAIASIPSRRSVLEAAMPVGYVYLSFTSTNPATLFGFGTWTKLENRALIGASSVYAVGSIGGNSSITLSANQMPTHQHSAQTSDAGWHTHTASTGAAGAGGGKTYDVWTYNGFEGSGRGVNGLRYQGFDDYEYDNIGTVGGGTNHTHSVTVSGNGTHSHTLDTTWAGGGQAIDIRNPYVAVYMWRRTA